jgi:nucleotide-binding universal stress UspA family protein
MADCLQEFFSRRPRSLALLLAGALSLQLTSAAAQDDARIIFADQLVSIHSDQAGLRPLLEELASQGGFKLWIADSVLSSAVSISVDKQPIEEALGRLLADNSFALVYDDAENLSALYVLPPGDSRPGGRVIMPDSVNQQQQAMQDALALDALPDNIKAAILFQMGDHGAEQQTVVASQRARAVETLVERLVQMGNPSPETIRQLKAKIVEFETMHNE